MRPTKKTIRDAFSKAAGTYDLHSNLQKDVALRLADRVRAYIDQHDTARIMDAFVQETVTATGQMTLFPAVGGKVLDIGCGTGNMAALLGNILAKADIYSTDLAMPMLEKTRERLKAKSFLAASDCESLPFIDSAFDIIVSSLAYQWAQDIVQAFKEAARTLKPGGHLFFTTLGPATLNELRECYNEASADGRYPGPEKYPDALALASFIREAGLELLSLEKQIVRMRYESIYSLVRTLKMIGAAPAQNSNTGRTASDMTLRRAGRIYAERFAVPEGGVIATYEVIIVSAKKIRIASAQ